MATLPLAIQRHRTAMKRHSLSKPLALALTHQVLAPCWSLFDYGCGQGTDIRLLQKVGINADGWDPHFKPQTEIKSADCVNLGYVLNVIENPEERRVTLQRAFTLATRVLIVSVRVDQALDNASEFSDGVLTKFGSFQKLYTQDEFRDYLRAALGRRPQMASLGIAYVFRDEQAEADYLAQLALYRPISSRESVRAEFSKDRIAQKYIALAKVLGRTPLETEFKSLSRLIERYGSLLRIERIAKSLLDSDMLASAQEERRVNILIFLAMLRLQGLTPPPIRSLSNEVQADVKMLWPNYKAAVQDGMDFLFELGRPGQIADECKRTRVGKKLPDALYVHKSAESQLSPLLQLMVLTAKQIVGEITYDLIKISTNGKKLSFLAYKDFDDAPHPELAYSLKLFLPKASYEIRSYNESLNPPILHRKETFLDPLHPRYAEYAQLTKQEEDFDLLSRPDIGTRNGWQALLESRKVRIENNSVASTIT